MTSENEKTEKVPCLPVSVTTRLQNGEVSTITLDQPIVTGDIGSFGSFRIIRQIGRGSAGAVFHAFDPTLKRHLALKILAPKVAGKKLHERFLREARACAKVRSAHVVTIYKTGERNGLPYIEMELLRGMPLDQYLQKHLQLRYPQLLKIGREVSLGLSAVHERNIVHRDIKPGNIWLEAPSGKAKLLDFGLVTADESADEEALTQVGTVVGTPAYMSPEQARGKAVDQQSDLFSLGVVLYHCATGRLPFSGKTSFEMLTALVSEEAMPLHQVNPSIPKPFSLLVKRLLAKNPKDRPASARAVYDEFKALSRTVSPSASASPLVSEQFDEASMPDASTENDWAIITSPSSEIRATKPERSKEPFSKPMLIVLTVAASVLVVMMILTVLIFRSR
ncbi:MAG: serine/threonine-protein kinase [Gemmataceae bacterium]